MKSYSSVMVSEKRELQFEFACLYTHLLCSHTHMCTQTQDKMVCLVSVGFTEELLCTVDYSLWEICRWLKGLFWIIDLWSIVLHARPFLIVRGDLFRYSIYYVAGVHSWNANSSEEAVYWPLFSLSKFLYWFCTDNLVTLNQQSGCIHTVHSKALTVNMKIPW